MKINLLESNSSNIFKVMFCFFVKMLTLYGFTLVLCKSLIITVSIFSSFFLNSLLIHINPDSKLPNYPMFLLSCPDINHISWYHYLDYAEKQHIYPAGTFQQSLKFRRWCDIESASKFWRQIFNVFSTPNKKR